MTIFVVSGVLFISHFWHEIDTRNRLIPFSLAIDKGEAFCITIAYYAFSRSSQSNYPKLGYQADHDRDNTPVKVVRLNKVVITPQNRVLYRSSSVYLPDLACYADWDLDNVPN